MIKDEAKKKGIEYISKEWNWDDDWEDCKTISEAIDIALKEQAKEIFEDIEKVLDLRVGSVSKYLSKVKQKLCKE